MANATNLQMSWLPLQKRKGGPVGLKNLGNSCYLNSVLQCLTYTPPLANFCLLNHHSSSCSSVNGTSNLACPFCLVERRIYRSLSIDQIADSPSKIHSCLSLFAKHFRHGCQEDAHEFLRYVIEACNSVCVKLQKLLCVTKLRAGQEDYKASKEEPRTVVKDIFGGVLQSQVKCLLCSAESNKLDDIMDLSLDVLQIGSLKEAMCRYFQPEVLDGNNKYRCEKCKKLSTARKQMSIFRAPNVLVIQLKRFENIHGGKVDRFISFEERLELVGHMCRASQDLRPEYLLYAVIVHAGYSQDSGHYYSYVKDANGKWFCCNDAHVTVVNSQSVLIEKAYILFYIRNDVKSKVKDKQSFQNGHVTLSSATQAKPAFLEVQQVSGKENTVNTSLCSADKVQPVKLNFLKPGSHGQTPKPLRGDTGRAPMSFKSATESSQTKEHLCTVHPRSNGNLEHLGNPTVVMNDDLVLQKQAQEKRQAGKSDLMKCTIETVQSSLDKREENIHVNFGSKCHKPEAALSKDLHKVLEISENKNRHGERNPFLEKTNAREIHTNGHSGSLGFANKLSSLPRRCMQQQQQQQDICKPSVGKVGGLSDSHGCKKTKISLLPNDFDTPSRTYGGIKRKLLENSLCSNAAYGEGEQFQRHVGRDMFYSEPPHQQYTSRDSELQSLKLGLGTDVRKWLHCSGWCDTVRDCFRDVKRRRLLQESLPLDLMKERLRCTPFELCLPSSRRYYGLGAQVSHRKSPLHRRLLSGLCSSGREVDGWQQRAGQVSSEGLVWADTLHSYAGFYPETSAGSGVCTPVLLDRGFQSRTLQYNCVYPWAKPSNPFL